MHSSTTVERRLCLSKGELESRVGNERRCSRAPTLAPTAMQRLLGLPPGSRVPSRGRSVRSPVSLGREPKRKPTWVARRSAPRVPPVVMYCSSVRSEGGGFCGVCAADCYVLLAAREDTRLSPAKAAVNRSKTLFDASAVVAELVVDGSTEARNYARLLRAAARADDDVWPAKILNKLPPHFETEALRPTQDSLREAARQLVVAANEMARQERAREKLAKTCALAATAAARSAPAAAGGAEDEGLCFHVEPGSSGEIYSDVPLFDQFRIHAKVVTNYV